MKEKKKRARYYYWFLVSFIKKHIRIFSISFLVSFIFIIAFISLSPYIETFFFNKKEIIGLIGKYNPNNLPEEITSKISNGLVYTDQNGKILPALASSWEILDNSKTYKIILKKNLFWSSGKKFTANDINYNFKNVKTEVIDNNIIIFRLDNPLPIFLGYLRKPILNYRLQGVAGIYKIGNIKLLSNKIKSLSLIPNKKGLSPILYKFYPNQSQLIVAYKKGEINKMTVSKKTIADSFADWKNTTIKTKVDYHNLLTLFFNFKNPLLNSKEMRKGIIMAINTDKLRDYGELAVGPIPSVSSVYNKNLKNSSYNPNLAREIFKKNIESSESAELSLVTYYDYLYLADNIINSLREAGLKIKLNLISHTAPENFDFLLAYWKVPLDPDQYYFWHSTQTQGNIGGYKNLKIDKLLEDGRSTLVFTKRKQIYEEFQKVALDDPPAVFLFYPYIYEIERK